MATAGYQVLHYPDKRLNQKAKPVTEFTAELQALIDEMFAIMYKSNGVGLAATQIGVDLQLTVIDPVGDKKLQLVLVNPEIIEAKEFVKKEEGCLSVPHYYDAVQRATKVKIRALDRHGKPFEMEDSGKLAHIFQHEIDHLNGILYVDKLSPLRKDRFKKKYKKEHHHCDSC